MSVSRLFFHRVDPRATLPSQRDGDVGLDIKCLEEFSIPPGKTVVIPTGLALAQNPLTWLGSVFLKIEDRSSMAKKGVFTHGGIIDPTYRGQFHVVLFNSTSEIFTAAAGDKIAQAVVYPAVFTHASSQSTLEIVECDEVEPTERGSGGFGSTGR